MVPDFSSRRYIHYPVRKGIIGTVVTNKEIIKVSEDKEWMGVTDRVDSVGVHVTSMICGAAKDAVTGKIIAVLQVRRSLLVLVMMSLLLLLLIIWRTQPGLIMIPRMLCMIRR